MADPIDASRSTRPDPTKLFCDKEDDPAIAQEERAKADARARGVYVDHAPDAGRKDQTPGGVPYSDLRMPAAKCDSQHTDLCPNDDGAKPMALPKTTNATRTAERKDGVFVTSHGSDGISSYAGITAVKATGKHGYIAVGSASVQGGGGVEVQVAALRASGKIDDKTTVSGEAFTAHASAGIGKNDDGSVGYHSGAGTTIGSIEGTHEFSDGGSGTLGLSAGVGADVSVGTKQASNGRTLACAHVAAGPLIVGICLPL